MYRAVCLPILRGAEGKPEDAPEAVGMRFAYADPPYFGMCKRYGHAHPEGGRPFDGRCWDDAETHRLLIDWLSVEFPDGWALSLSSPSLRTLLPMCPPTVRVMAWVKAWASWKPNVSPAYAWEPVITCGGRKGRRKTERAQGMGTVSDWLRVVARQDGFFGAKPDAFMWWLCASLNVSATDEFVDLFHGSGASRDALTAWQRQSPLGLESVS